MQYDTAVDYLTVTFRCQKEWEASVKEIGKLIDLPTKRRPWFFYGYSGFSQADFDGHFASGRGTRGGIIQASGGVSDFLCRIYECWLPDRVRFTRLDLALTFTLNRVLPLVRQATENSRDDWTVILPSPKTGGGTLYVGSRRSSSFGRLYDKGAELNSRLPVGQKIATNWLWRAELEVKADSARAMFSEVVKAQARGGLREFIADTTLTWFAGRGVYLPVIPNSSSIVSVAHRASDNVRSIKWLHEQVRPCVWRLAENGKLAEVAEALNVRPQNFALAAYRYTEENYNQFSFFDQLS